MVRQCLRRKTRISLLADKVGKDHFFLLGARHAKLLASLYAPQK